MLLCSDGFRHSLFDDKFGSYCPGEFDSIRAGAITRSLTSPTWYAMFSGGDRQQPPRPDRQCRRPHVICSARKERVHVDHRLAGFGPDRLVSSEAQDRDQTGEGVILDIVLQMFGGVVGGFLFSLIGAQGVTGFNLYSMFVAVIGAIVVLVVFDALVPRIGE